MQTATVGEVEISVLNFGVESAAKTCIFSENDEKRNDETMQLSAPFKTLETKKYLYFNLSFIIDGMSCRCTQKPEKPMIPQSAGKEIFP